MKLYYFAVDARGQLRRVSDEALRGLWEGRLSADSLGCPAGSELRLVSVTCDAELTPRKIFLLRLPLHAGKFTEESYLTLRLFTRPDCITRRELTEHHTAGWPRHLFQQLAVALDVPVTSLHMPLKVGGPLFLAAALRVTPHQALRHLR